MSTEAQDECTVENCQRPASPRGDSLSDFCNDHAREWLQAEASLERREVAA